MFCKELPKIAEGLMLLRIGNDSFFPKNGCFYAAALVSPDRDGKAEEEGEGCIGKVYGFAVDQDKVVSRWGYIARNMNSVRNVRAKGALGEKAHGTKGRSGCR